MVMHVLRSKKFAKRVLIGLLIVIIPAFVLWGVGNLSSRPGPVGRIGSKKISVEDFAKSRQGIKVQVLFSYFGDTQALNNILQNQTLLNFMAWERLMLLDALKGMRIKISNNELLSFITRHPLFQRKGVFDKNIYAYVLKNNLSMDPRQFEELVRENLKIRAFRHHLLKDVTVSEDEVLEVYRKRNDKTEVSYILIDKDSAGDEVIVSEKEILSAYETNKGNFMEPSKAIVEYIEFPYEDAAQRDSAMRKIEKVYMELAKDPTKFRETAEKYGFKYGKTPPFSREEVIPGVVFFTRFHESAFSLKDGEIGTPVFSSPDKGAGYILRKTGQVPPRPMKFEEVRDKIKSRIQDEKKMRAAGKIAEDMSKKLSSGEATLETAAEELDIEIGSTGTVSVNDYIENVGPAGIVVLTAQETGEGKVMPPVPVKKGVLIGRVEKIVRASEKDFEKTKDTLRQEILTNKQMQVMDNWFKQNRTKTKLNKPLDEL
jgi:peptidyl-prolyl cis-trans isomerase D